MPPSIADVIVSALPFLKGVVGYADVLVTAIPRFGLGTPLILLMIAVGTLLFVGSD